MTTTSKVLLFLSIFGLTAHNAHANYLALSCDILNEHYVSQSTFSPDDTAIFKADVNLSNNGLPFDPSVEYKIDLKITAKAKIKGFKVPFQFNQQSFVVPVKNIDEDALVATKEAEIKMPSIHGSLTLTISANVANSVDSKSKAVTCEKTLTIR